VSDVLFRGATVYDGSGSPGRKQDVAIVDGRIATLGEEAVGVGVERTLDVGGLALAPGFIDMHSHADHTLPAFPRATNSLSQGVTTELIGLCGFSPAPVSADPERAAALRDMVSVPISTGAGAPSPSFSSACRRPVRRSTSRRWSGTTRSASRAWAWPIGRRAPMSWPRCAQSWPAPWRRAPGA
jgi:hypothetical protein